MRGDFFLLHIFWEDGHEGFGIGAGVFFDLDDELLLVVGDAVESMEYFLF